MKLFLLILLQAFSFHSLMAQDVLVQSLDEIDFRKANEELRKVYPDSIEKIFAEQNIDMTLSSPFILTSSTSKYVCDDNECSLRNKIGMARAVVKHEDNECAVYLYSSMKAINGNPQSIPEFMGGGKNMSIYNKIKNDLNWAVVKRPQYADIFEKEELDMLMTHCSKKMAKKYFNAEYMMMYPLNMRKEKCSGKFSRARCVVAGKDYRFVFIYFLMTDSSIKNFDRYLEQLKGMIWFN